MASVRVSDVIKAITDQSIQCKVCGKSYLSLIEHLIKEHGITPSHYTSKFPGASVTAPIISNFLINVPKSVEFSLDSALDKLLRSCAVKGNKIESWLDNVAAELPATTVHPELIPEIDPEFVFPEKETRGLVSAIVLGMNVYISGPTGCGKTDLVKQVFARLKRPLFRANMTGDTSVKNFIGVKEVDPAKGTYYRKGILPQAMSSLNSVGQSEGCCLLIDEGDFMPPHIGAALHPALERNSRSVYIPDADETVMAEKGFHVIITANTGGKGESAGAYTGTEILNTAFLDRFSIKMNADYPPEKIQLKILEGKFPGEDQAFLKRLVKTAVEIQKGFKQESIGHTFSIRRQIDLVFLATMIGKEEAIESALLNWADEEERALITEIASRCGLIGTRVTETHDIAD